MRSLIEENADLKHITIPLVLFHVKLVGTYISSGVEHRKKNHNKFFKATINLNLNIDEPVINTS